MPANPPVSQIAGKRRQTAGVAKPLLCSIAAEVEKFAIGAFAALGGGRRQPFGGDHRAHVGQRLPHTRFQRGIEGERCHRCGGDLVKETLRHRALVRLLNQQRITGKLESMVDTGTALSANNVSQSGLMNDGSTTLMGTATFTGAISGTGGLTVTSTGSLTAGNIAQASLANNGMATITGTATFTGTVSGTGALMVAPGATLTATDLSQSNLVDNGSVAISGSTSLGSVSGSGSLSTPAGSSLTVANLILQGAEVNNAVLTITNSGQFGPLTGTGSLVVGNSLQAATVNLIRGSGVSSQTGLVINFAGQLNIDNNKLEINYPAGADPVQSIRLYLQIAYNNDTWTGPGLTSDIAKAKPSQYAVGYSDNTTTDQITVSLTVPGDTNLSGSTDFTDLTTVAQFFGTSTAKGNNVQWFTGDLNYDNQVDFKDLTLVAQYFGDSLTKAEAGGLPTSFLAQWNLARAEVAAADGTSSVPEPTVAGLAMISAAGLLARRRRRTCDAPMERR